MSINILLFRVYQILLEHTDGDHALPMGKLLRLLRTEHGLRCDRRAVYAAPDKLRAVGCHIPEYQDDGEGYRLLSRPLEPSEVRLLGDAVSAFPGVSQRQCERLLEKLGRGLSRWQREHCRPLVTRTPWRGSNQETFLSVEVLEEAVSRRCQVEFQYMEYGMNKRLHPRRERPYQVSPYGLCFANGNYYLLCRYQGAEDISHYRVDRIQSPVLLEDQLAAPAPPGLDLEGVYSGAADQWGNPRRPLQKQFKWERIQGRLVFLLCSLHSFFLKNVAVPRFAQYSLTNSSVSCIY